jgi:hypothetical protein
MIPTGGLGMNSGVGDAIDLAWKLEGTLRGWGGPSLLASYETERRQIGGRNVAASRYASQGRRKWRSLWRDLDQLVEVAKVEQPKSNEMIGAELGYRYQDSPLIANEPGGPEDPLRKYQPTTWPGARLPHVWLEGHRRSRIASAAATPCCALADPEKKFSVEKSHEGAVRSARYSGCRGARPLRLRPDPAAAGPAYRVAR